MQFRKTNRKKEEYKTCGGQWENNTGLNRKLRRKKRENTKATTFKNIIVGNFLKHINDNYKQFQEAQKPRQEK